MKFVTFDYSALCKILVCILPCIAATCSYLYWAQHHAPTSQFVEHFFDRARAFHAHGNSDDAKKEYLQLLKHDPDCAPAHFNLAQLYAGDKEWLFACNHYQQALASESLNEAEKHLIHFCYGTALFRLNKLHEAKEQLDCSLALQPLTKVYMQRSLVLTQLGKLDAAKDDLDRVVQEDSSFARGYLELGSKYRDVHEFDKAIDCFKQVVTHMPAHYAGYLMLADATHLYAKQTNDDTLVPETMQLYHQAIACNPDCYQAEVNLGLMYMEQDNDEKALQLFNHAYQTNPEFPNTNIAKGICHIKREELQQGWPGYEWRTAISPSRFEHIARWNGTDSLQNKTILLHAEQGFGDTLHFIRYAQVAKQMGAQVIVETQARLKQLLTLCPYIDTLITEFDPIPACDYQLPLLSMPTVLQTSLETIPNQIPYLYAQNALRSEWQQQLAHDPNFKIGICWQVNKDHDFTKYSNESVKIQIPTPRRAIDLDYFAPLAQQKGVTVYSLQFGASADECHKRGIKTFDGLDTAHGPFMDTAAIIHSLDLVITVDTATAHLAGALGAQTWILLPFAAEWRWFKNRTDTPWYPTARLFRCSHKENWCSVFNEVQSELQKLVH